MACFDLTWSNLTGCKLQLCVHAWFCETKYITLQQFQVPCNCTFNFESSRNSTLSLSSYLASSKTSLRGHRCNEIILWFIRSFYIDTRWSPETLRLMPSLFFHHCCITQNHSRRLIQEPKIKAQPLLTFSGSLYSDTCVHPTPPLYKCSQRFHDMNIIRNRGI